MHSQIASRVRNLLSPGHFFTNLGIACLRSLSNEMDDLEKQLHEMLVEEARNIFEMLLQNGDMNEQQFKNIQSSIVQANRTADTIQVSSSLAMCNHSVRNPCKIC